MQHDVGDAHPLYDMLIELGYERILSFEREKEQLSKARQGYAIEYKDKAQRVNRERMKQQQMQQSGRSQGQEQTSMLMTLSLLSFCRGL